MKPLIVLFAVAVGAAAPFAQASPVTQTSVVVISASKAPRTRAISPQLTKSLSPRHAFYRVTSVVPTGSHIPAVVEFDGSWHVRNAIWSEKFSGDIGLDGAPDLGKIDPAISTR